MLLNQQQKKATDTSSFALTASRPPYSQPFRGKAPPFSRFPSRNFNSRPQNGYPPSRGQYQQSSRGPQQINTYPNQLYRQSTQQPPSQGNQFSNQRSSYFNKPYPNSHLQNQGNQGNLQGNSFNNNNSRVPCQICGKLSHLAIDCYHRMDYAFQGRNPPPQLAAMVAHTNAAYEEQNWLADSGANTHITHDLENLQI
jgi:hypothetical protein